MAYFAGLDVGLNASALCVVDAKPSLEWQGLSNGFGDRYLLHLAVDPNDHDRFFASTRHNKLMASRDGGRTWRVLAAP